MSELLLRTLAGGKARCLCDVIPRGTQSQSVLYVPVPYSRECIVDGFGHILNSEQRLVEFSAFR